MAVELTEYTFSISTSTPNGVVDLARLHEELHKVDIVPSLFEIHTIGDSLTITFKAPLTGSEPQILNDLLATHTGEPLKEIQEIKTFTEYPRGLGFRKRTPDLTTLDYKWSFSVAEGKQVLFRQNKVIFNDKIENVPPIVFEIEKKIGDEYFIVYQNYYSSFRDLMTDTDEIQCHNTGDGNIIRLLFDWPNYASVDRKPMVINAGDKVNIYFTNDAEHDGVGTIAPAKYYIHPTYGIVCYNSYDIATELPNWPDPAPNIPIAQVCVHCASYEAGELE